MYCLKDILRLAITSDSIYIQNKVYTQQKGLAMGNPLSPILAIIYVDYIEK